MSNHKRILLVDDDPAFLQVMRRSMERRDFEVLQASEATAALELAQSQQPDYILLDLNLPGDSGLITLPKLLAQAPEAAVVILTGYSSIATAVKAMKLGARDYLCKPAGLEEILSAFAGGAGREEGEITDTPLSVDRLEWEHIQKILHQNNGNVSATAKALGMHRRTLQRKLQKRPVKH